MSPKQRTIIAAIRERGEITLRGAVGLIGGDIYTNAEKHVGAVLANMVKRGMIVRVKPGVFGLVSSQFEKRKYVLQAGNVGEWKRSSQRMLRRLGV